ncbi:ferredoxin reductase [Amycolatopsis sp. YIM 10]|uniref:ferredoxin reductase n=1 Tax=Amycolatopsis sp. YIM 10 TaxID=2653857 RepID=UPI00128FE7B9|nr:ferredoxin reductase [Amycolatopsis sp. YIM 10]QFU89397.1 Stearoyl-CoA 9-desaturase electron transfer partner [Amycolatopsis sp. YIM 10]
MAVFPPGVRRLREVAARLTTPLLPDDYLSQVNPLWSARALRGRVVTVVPETADAATLVIKPGWGWTFAHQPGQYVGIAVAVNGRFHWRSYSLTSAPAHSGGTITITVKAMPEGMLSEHLVRGLEPGTVVRLALPRGEFVLPDPPPPKLLFVTAGSGITPVMAMLRTMDTRGSMTDVVLVHTARDADATLFLGELRELSRRHPGLVLHERFSGHHGRLSLATGLDPLCPDWRERQAWVCGPAAMLDAAKAVWAAAGLTDALHLESFGAAFDGGTAEGGTVRFAASGVSVEADGATTLMQAGERAGITMPFGCRMGICHTCVVPLAEGRVRDLRTGAEHRGGHGDRPKIQTCVTAAAGDCVLVR